MSLVRSASYKTILQQNTGINHIDNFLKSISSQYLSPYEGISKMFQIHGRQQKSLAMRSVQHSNLGLDFCQGDQHLITMCLQYKNSDPDMFKEKPEKYTIPI